MKVRLAVALALLLLLTQAYPAMATWGSFVLLGTNTVNLIRRARRSPAALQSARPAVLQTQCW